MSDVGLPQLLRTYVCLVFFMRTPDRSIHLEVRTDGDTVWLTQQQMAQLFGRDVTTIRKHIKAAREDA